MKKIIVMVLVGMLLSGCGYIHKHSKDVEKDVLNCNNPFLNTEECRND